MPMIRARGLSVAKQLMAEVEKRANHDDCDVYLETSSAQYPAIGLYKKLNYEVSEGSVRNGKF